MNKNLKDFAQRFKLLQQKGNKELKQSKLVLNNNNPHDELKKIKFPIILNPPINLHVDRIKEFYSNCQDQDYFLINYQNSQLISTNLVTYDTLEFSLVESKIKADLEIIMNQKNVHVMYIFNKNSFKLYVFIYAFSHSIDGNMIKKALLYKSLEDYDSPNSEKLEFIDSIIELDSFKQYSITKTTGFVLEIIKSLNNLNTFNITNNTSFKNIDNINICFKEFLENEFNSDNMSNMIYNDEDCLISLVNYLLKSYSQYFPILDNLFKTESNSLIKKILKKCKAQEDVLTIIQHSNKYFNCPVDFILLSQKENNIFTKFNLNQLEKIDNITSEGYMSSDIKILNLKDKKNVDIRNFFDNKKVTTYSNDYISFIYDVSKYITSLSNDSINIIIKLLKDKDLSSSNHINLLTESSFKENIFFNLSNSNIIKNKLIKESVSKLSIIITSAKDKLIKGTKPKLVNINLIISGITEYLINQKSISDYFTQDKKHKIRFIAELLIKPQESNNIIKFNDSFIREIVILNRILNVFGIFNKFKFIMKNKITLSNLNKLLNKENQSFTSNLPDFNEIIDYDVFYAFISRLFEKENNTFDELFTVETIKDKCIETIILYICKLFNSDSSIIKVNTEGKEALVALEYSNFVDGLNTIFIRREDILEFSLSTHFFNCKIINKIVDLITNKDSKFIKAYIILITCNNMKGKESLFRNGLLLSKLLALKLDKVLYYAHLINNNASIIHHGIKIKLLQSNINNGSNKFLEDNDTLRKCLLRSTCKEELREHIENYNTMSALALFKKNKHVDYDLCSFKYVVITNNNSLYDNYTGRRVYENNKLVEQVALSYYKTLNYSGLHAENSILPCLYEIFFYDEMHANENNYLFPSQCLPYDFFESSYYIRNKDQLSSKLKHISKMNYKDISDYIDLFNSRNLTYFSFIRRFPNEIIKKIAIAFGGKRLSLILESLCIKFLPTGFPDLFLWPDKLSPKDLEGKIKICEVKSESDNLSPEQKWWILNLIYAEVDTEVLRIK